jgi:hypothetical protein
MILIGFVLSIRKSFNAYIFPKNSEEAANE